MPSLCCVWGCDETGTAGEACLHRFPDDSKLKHHWNKFVNVTRKWKGPTKYSKICSRHFKSEDFTNFHQVKSGIGKLFVLNRDAVPSVYPHKSSLDDACTSRTAFRKREINRNPYYPPSTINTTQRLVDLRNEMQSSNFQAYIVPSEDSHLSEYIAPRDKRREYISGFSGSAGVAVVTMTEAALWTDARYYTEAERTLDCNWILMKAGEPGVSSIEEWIVEKLAKDETVAAYPFVISIDAWEAYDSYFTDRYINFNTSEPDLVDLIWDTKPPSLGDNIIHHPVEYGGQDWRDKLSDTRSTMIDAGTDVLLLTLLDEVAWFFNLRGNDVPYTPVFTSYAIIHKSDYVKLYANDTMFTEDVTKYIISEDCVTDKSCVEILPYELASTDLKALSSNGETVWMAKDTTTYGMYKQVDISQQYQGESPIKVPKGIKNEVQIEAIKQAHIYDSLSLCEFLMWLDNNVPGGEVDELSAAAKVLEIRMSNGECKGASFSSISASGPNAALPHYSNSEDTNRKLGNEMFLLDSGGQYLQGTSDITRTVRFGEPTDFEIEAFTLVLMGVIDIETARWCSVYSRDGNYIDILARQHLYDVGLEFRHGTGHGVGQYLAIHEYPPGIGGSYADGYRLVPGMFTTIEPGYYEEGEFGIRHENFLLIKKVDLKYKFGDYDFYGFESVTLVPFQRSMINAELMSDKQLDYLNKYHQRVKDVIGEEAKRLNKMDVYDWITEATQPITRSSASHAVSPTLLYFAMFALTKTLHNLN